MEASANPNPEHTQEVVDAIRYLQDIENKHAQFARPRFGKRGNEYLNKEYTNNYLRFLLENPEYFRQLQQQQES
ncbi:hypothetical protein PVAND_001909 [Polypedilum vanderplanki]|uniref:Uncharacterized protein n=1 Tax=Polypedilum vanderplanki TaxID=319348 RepID=A0A9J6BPC6_POLVA|nr:hypothetical protein PVAND_001909 [Polypedilum vanderplanki]